MANPASQREAGRQAQALLARTLAGTRTGQYTAGTRYRHWLTVRALVHALGRQDHWLPHLQGPWLRPTGRTGRLKAGRPPKLRRLLLSA